ncbi:MAG: type III PLP-dependent enzyme, partial [Pseudomonadota bacterium]|nr:type III PLP-dependent enzyme [Pseudomonadota bacterium]
MSHKIARFLADQRPGTPCLVVDLDVVERNYLALRDAAPWADIYYAVKANPAPPILSLLNRLGSKFDA